MQRIKLFVILLIVAICLSGCGERIRFKKEITDRLQVRTPKIIGMKDRAVQEKINILLYSTAFELRDKNRSEVAKYSESYNYYVQSEVTRHNKLLLSARYMECLVMPWYAHPLNSMQAVTVNLKDGSVYKLSDLFKPGSDYRAVLNKILDEKVQAYANKTGVKMLEKFRGIEKDQGFYLTRDSLAIYWQEAVYLPRYLGPLSIMVEYKRLSGILRDDLRF